MNNKQKLTRCKTCGKYFLYLPSNRAGKYCSFECYKKKCSGEHNNNFKNAGIRHCHYCGKEFQTYDRRRKYCSWACHVKRNYIQLECKFCHKTFEVPKNRKQRQFCGQICWNKFKTQTGTTTKKCIICEKEFKIRVSMDNQKCCGLDCLKKYKRESMKGEGNHRWLGGISRNRGSDWNEQRQKCYERDEGTCQVCGEQIRRIDVHHIIPYRISKCNELNNLICLCTVCHVQEENHYRQFKKPSYLIKELIKTQEG